MTGTAGAIYWARNIHDSLTVANTNGWMMYRFIDDGTQTYGLYNEGAAAYSKTHWTLGNWSKFVRPGWVRIGATANPVSGVYITAFTEVSSGIFAIVAVNQNSSSVNLTVSLSGFPSVTLVTPVLTSDNTNLVDQSKVSVNSGEFSYSLPATSVVTFHSAASSPSSNAPTAPSNLTATVH